MRENGNAQIDDDVRTMMAVVATLDRAIYYCYCAQHRALAP
jgi:hypothetical protein